VGKPAAVALCGGFFLWRKLLPSPFLEIFVEKHDGWRWRASDRGAGYYALKS
jgi:hypothetical protein